MASPDISSRCSAGGQKTSPGPFVHFVRDLAKGLPEGAVSSIEAFSGDTIDRYRIAEDTLRECTGISGDEEETEILDHIRSGGIDLGKCLRARRERDDVGYRQWLRDESARSEEESRRELIEIFGESVLRKVSDTVAAASHEREDR